MCLKFFCCTGQHIENEQGLTSLLVLSSFQVLTNVHPHIWGYYNTLVLWISACLNSTLERRNKHSSVLYTEHWEAFLTDIWTGYSRKTTGGTPHINNSSDPFKQWEWASVHNTTALEQMFVKPDMLTCHSSLSTDVINDINDGCILFMCTRSRALVLCMLPHSHDLLGNFNDREPPLM